MCGKDGQPQVRSQDIDDLHYRYYRDSWNKLPDFDNLKPESEGAIASGLFDIGLRTRDTAFGFVFSGSLIVPQAGNYTFYLDSDDGSRLTIDGKPLIEYDGIHGTGQEHQATVSLKAGRLPIKLEYFQNMHGLGLNVAWAGPGIERRALSAVSPSAAKKNSRHSGKAVPDDLGKAVLQDGEEVLGKERYAEYRKLRHELDEWKHAAGP